MSVEFRNRLRSRDLLCGSFVKTPQYQNVEIAAGAGLDWVVLDAEHAPFTAAQIDQCLLACRAHHMASIVRLQGADATTVLQVLDMGASGILVPHIASAAQAQEVVARTRYREGVRGFSNSPRAGHYGKVSMEEHIARCDAGVSVMCQIEDREAVEQIDEIAAVNGVDCLFIGPADLAVSYRVYDIAHAKVVGAIESIAAAGRAANVPVGIFLADDSSLERFSALGISTFLIGSDQSVLRVGLTRLVSRFSAFQQSQNQHGGRSSPLVEGIS